MSKPTTNRFSPEVRSRAVWMVFDHQAEHSSQWAAINSIAGKIGCTGETLRNWVRHCSPCAAGIVTAFIAAPDQELHTACADSAPGADPSALSRP